MDTPRTCLGSRWRRPATGARIRDSVDAEAAAWPIEERGDLRGWFVLINEDSGEIVGALDRSVRAREDSSLGEKVARRIWS